MKKKFNLRNVVAIAICLVGMTVFSACDKGDDNDGNNNNGDNGEETGITAGNWQQTVQNIYGVNLSLPSGWSFKSGKQSGSGSYITHDIQFTTTVDDFGTAFIALAQQVFNATAMTSEQHGNFEAESLYPTFIKGNKLDALPVLIDTVIMPWYFAKSDGRVIQCVVNDASTTKTAQISFITTTGIVNP